MATFIMIGKYTGEALKGISAERTKKAREVLKKCGGSLEDGYVLLGQSDLVLIAELPGTAEAMKASVELARLTGIAFATSPAVSVEEFDKLASKT
jgi:uncharacterized protein with GYD domain